MRLRAHFKRGWLPLACLMGWASPILAAEGETAPPLFTALQQEVQRVFGKCSPAIARIEAMDDHGQLSGTGFFIDPNGTLFTSYSVGGDYSREVVAVVGELKYAARRLVADERAGIAILKVEAKTPFLPMGVSQDLAVASPVMTVGYPMDLPLTPSFGMVGGFDRKYLGRYFATTHLRANLPVQRGEGGAPLLNMKGEVVGILISSLDQGSASFALPIEAAEKIRADFVRFGEVRPGWLGLSVVPAAAARNGSSAQVQDVFPGMPAEKAGVNTADILLSVGGRKVTQPEDMVDACYFLSAEEPVAMTVDRGGELLEFTVETSDVPGRRHIAPALTLGPEQGAALKIVP